MRQLLVSRPRVATPEMTRDGRLNLNIPTAIGAETQGRRYSGTAFLAMNWSSLVAVGPM
jgi:hypothetical protein